MDFNDSSYILIHEFRSEISTYSLPNHEDLQFSELYFIAVYYSTPGLGSAAVTGRDY